MMLTLSGKRKAKLLPKYTNDLCVRVLHASCFLKLESFATRCEALLPCDRERCIIRTIFVAGGRTEMAISYNKLWKLLVDKKMSKADLRKAAGIAPNTMTRLRRDEEVTLSVLNRICVALDVNIGDVMEFTNTERDGEYEG